MPAVPQPVTAPPGVVQVELTSVRPVRSKRGAAASWQLKSTAGLLRASGEPPGAYSYEPGDHQPGDQPEWYTMNRS